MKSLSHHLFERVNNSRLVAFRILFGLVMAAECIKDITSGMVQEFYIDSAYNFTFIGFEWLNVLHGKSMYIYYGAMALCALFLSAGLFYRASSLLLALLWTAVYLSQKTHYNNHYYLMVLLCWLMALMPASRRFSADVKFRFIQPQNECFRWQINLFIFQVACIYFFSAIAKMSTDWLHAAPLKQWLQHKTGLRFIGWAFRNPAVPWMVAYGGLFFDALVIPGLLYRRTRVLVFVLAVLFHAFNGYVFKIGTFPFLAIALNVFFLPSSLFDKIIASHANTFGVLKISVAMQRVITCFAAAYVLLQLYLPLRHLLIKGDVMWTEEGHRMSWRMMLRSKSGTCYFKVVNTKNDSTWIIQPASLFNSAQMRAIAVLPDVTWQAAQYLKNKYQQQGMNTAIFAHNEVSLNFHPAKLLIDSSCNLANAKWNRWQHNHWILLQNN